MPSAPTAYPARRVCPVLMVRVTPSASWTTEATSYGRCTSWPSARSRASSTLSVSDCGDHQGVRVGRRQPVERHGEQPAGAVADGEPGDRDAAGDQRLGGAELVQHLQGAGVHDGGPGGVGALGQPVHDDEFDAGGCEGDGQRESGRAGADDGDLGVGGQRGWWSCSVAPSLDSATMANSRWPTLVDTMVPQSRTESQQLMAYSCWHDRRAVRTPARRSAPTGPRRRSCGPPGSGSRPRATTARPSAPSPPTPASTRRW